MAAFGLRNILSLFLLADLALLGLAGSHWEQEKVVANQGDDVTIRCYVTGLVDGFLDIVRLNRMKPDGINKEVITDKLTMREAFNLTGRYKVNYTEKFDEQKGIIELHYTGIRGEDAGKIGCMRLNEDESLSFMTLIVHVPVRSVTMLMIKGETHIKMAEGSTIHMKEDDGDGVGCVARVDGSSTPPGLIVMVDGVDSTDQFVRHEKVQPKPGANGALTRQTAVTKLLYVNAKPSADFNGKNLTCIGSMDGTPNKQASILMDVQYTPIITCPKYENYAQLKKKVVIKCLVRSNPGSMIIWTHNKEKQGMNISEKPEFEETILVEKLAMNEDELEVKFTFSHIQKNHFTTYHLNATNDIGSSDITLTLMEGSNPDATPAPSPGGGPAHQGSDKPSQNAPETAPIQGGNGCGSVWPQYSLLLVVLLAWLAR